MTDALICLTLLSDEEGDFMSDQHQKPQGIAVNVNVDTTPILYTDNIFMTTDENGVTLDVCQKLPGNNQFRIVSRVGMSREHAKKFVTEMGRLLAMTEGNVQTGKKKN